VVKTKDQRLFRQISELKRENQQEIKIRIQNQEVSPPAVATWPQPGRGNAAKVAFSRHCWFCWGSVCSPYHRTPSPVWFLPI